MKKLFVGNLSWGTQEHDLEDLFATYGTVQSVKIILDRDTGRSRGFGFVEMDEAGADEAMSNLDGAELDGRNLRVNEATERKPRRDNW